MSFNGQLKKYGIIAIVTGSILGVIAFGILLNIAKLPTNEQLPPPPTTQKGIGFRIAQRMLTSQDNVSYVWCYNNTWVNENLSAHYGKFIDGIRVGFINDTPSMALIHEPEAEVSAINSSEFNEVMTSFRGALSVLDNTSTIIDNLIEIWPPTFMIDIAYENGSSLSLVYSKEHNILGAINGTWSLSSYEQFGIKTIRVHFIEDSTVFFPLTDNTLLIKAMNDLAEYIYGVFPT